MGQRLLVMLTDTYPYDVGEELNQLPTQQVCRQSHRRRCVNSPVSLKTKKYSGGTPLAGDLPDGKNLARESPLPLRKANRQRIPQLQAARAGWQERSNAPAQYADFAAHLRAISEGLCQ